MGSGCGCTTDWLASALSGGAICLFGIAFALNGVRARLTPRDLRGMKFELQDLDF